MTGAGVKVFFVPVTPLPSTTPPICWKSTSSPSSSMTKALEPYSPSAAEPALTEFVIDTSIATAPESPTVVSSGTVTVFSCAWTLPPRVTEPKVHPEMSVPGSAATSMKSVEKV